jgi:hypothetical protein
MTIWDYDLGRGEEPLSITSWGVATLQDEMGHIASDHNSYISAKISPNRRLQVGI